MHMRVSADQFVVDGDRLTHTPSGAVFWLGDKDVVLCEAGAAGQTLSGGDYNIEELKETARHILHTEKSSCL
jgi:hypothetical protein